MNIDEIVKLEGQTLELTRYQPLMAVTQERLECGECGLLAIYLILIQDDGKEQNGLCFYCQSCFEKAQDGE